jgi:ABC-type bacteriocin/lantibiotic exporter with double-glycine peptidase domain
LRAGAQCGHGSTVLRARVVLIFGWFACAALSGGCAHVYIGSATNLPEQKFAHEAGWISVQNVPLQHQRDEHDCGPTALAMVLDFFQPERRGEALALPHDRQLTVAELRDAARQRGLTAFIVEGTPEDLVFELSHGRPAIVGVAKPTLSSAVTHYEVVVGINKESQQFATLDPAVGLRQNSFRGFLMEWQATGRVLLVIAAPDPNPAPKPAAPALGAADAKR